MNKINKNLCLSSQFEEWYRQDTGRPYKSSADPFHDDVLSELLILQDGLCAYTEFRLVDHKTLAAYKDGFVDGKQTAPISNKHMSQIEHFDPAEKKMRGWNWDNLFAVFGPINEDKGSKATDPILKPDHPDYDPWTLLDYDLEEHMFFPHTELPDEQKELIRKMVLVLGLNNPTILLQRRKEVTQALDREKWLGEPATVDQFPTAFAMLQRKRTP